MTLITSRAEALWISQNPIKASDYLYTRDLQLGRDHYVALKRYIVDELHEVINNPASEIEDRRNVAELKSIWHDYRTKMDSFAKHSGVRFIPEYHYAL